MTNLFKTTALVVLTAICLNAQAQGISAADQKGIETCYNGIMAAFDKFDAKAMIPFMAEHVEQIIPNGTIVRGRDNVVASMAGYMEFLKTQPKPDNVDIKNNNWESRYLAPDVILSTYTEVATYTYGSQSKVETTTTAIVLRKVKGQWLTELIGLTPVVEMPKQ